MQDMKPNEGTIYPAARITQSGVGALGIEVMAFGTEYPTPHIRFCHEIIIQDASKNSVGWGDVIFKGTLQELINLVRKEETNGPTG